VFVIAEFGDDWREKLASIWGPQEPEHKHYNDETACALRQARNRYFKYIMMGSMGLIREKSDEEIRREPAALLKTVNQIASLVGASIQLIPAKEDKARCAVVVDGEWVGSTNVANLHQAFTKRISDCGGNMDELELGDTTEEDLHNCLSYCL